MAEKLRFELVSPERLVFAQDVDMVVVPGAEGDFGVLKGHAPVISTVRKGVIDIHDGGKVTERIFVAGGFAEVTGERCVVLAEEATPLASLDRAAIEAGLKDLREDLGAAKTDAARADLADRIETLEAQRTALG